MSEYLIEAKGVTKIFSSKSIFRRVKVKAVDNVYLAIPKDKVTIITLVGESGSGKSTMARLLLGLEIPTHGEILYKGKNIRKMSKNEMLSYRRAVQAIFQDPYGSYNPFYTVKHTLNTPIKKLKLIAKNEEEKLVKEALEAVHVNPEILDKFPHELSGGERQRVLIARALLTRPELIIADEPVSMVDASLRADIINTLKELKEKFRISFLYITHDLSTAYYISDEIWVMYRGSIVEGGDVEAVLKEPVHPYLQNLISSIPIPNPEKRWMERIAIKTEEISYKEIEQGCKYLRRCPKAHDCCSKESPSLLSIGPNHYVACHLAK
jgi:oligopeptide/dipeptide ABC transporter ATP-binding protein